MSAGKASHSHGMWAEVSSSVPHLTGGTREQTAYRPHILPPTLPKTPRNGLQTLQYKTEQAQNTHTHTPHTNHTHTTHRTTHTHTHTTHLHTPHHTTPHHTRPHTHTHTHTVV